MKGYLLDCFLHLAPFFLIFIILGSLIVFLKNVYYNVLTWRHHLDRVRFHVMLMVGRTTNNAEMAVTHNAIDQLFTKDQTTDSTTKNDKVDESVSGKIIKEMESLKEAIAKLKP